MAIKSSCQGFPVGLVVKNLPCNAKDTGSVPGPGRSHMPQSNQARVLQLLNPCTATPEAHEPRAVLCSQRSQHNEKFQLHNAE